MSLVQFNFESQYLGNNTTISIILPDKPRTVDAKDYYSKDKKYKVLWLLHGTFGDHSDWVRKSMIEIYAREKDLICVMPSALNSDYVNWPGFATGFYMGDFLTEELMPLIYGWFPASSAPEDNFIAGLSMGGSGALRYILNNPDKFAAGAILSSAPWNAEDIDWTGEKEGNLFRSIRNPRFCNSVENAGGKEAYLEKNDTWKQVFDMNSQGKLPKLLFGCGTKDSMYPSYCKFKDACAEKNVDIRFEELPDLAHEWRFWDPFIQKALAFFGLDDKIDPYTLF